MTDETIRVVYDVTEKGMENVRRIIGDIRKELGNAGVDTSRFETRLEGLERTVQKVNRALKAAGTAAQNTGQSGAAAAKQSSDAWEKLRTDIAAAQRQADRGITAATTQQRNRPSAINASDANLARQWDAEFAAATKSARDFEKAQGNIIAQRYALYDVATTYGLIGTALAGAAVYAAVVGARFESAFTNVERTLQGGTLPAEVDAIRQSLIQLSGQIPLTFQELSQIATIGNQMGIAKDDVVDFTGTIARFASVSGLSIDSVTKAFGGFMAQTGLAPQYLENLGSSIAKVGIDSNATEEQIVSLMREITAGAKTAGFTADQIVGLSGTLAGLQVAPERARGSLSTYFNTLNSAVAEGGDKLAQFATVIGVTSDELERMVRSGQGNEILRRFIGSLNELDNVDTTSALDALGLAQLRVSDTFIRLSSALSIYDRDQRNANEAFIQGAELQRQYAMTVDDLASQWTIFINNLNAVVDAISGGAIPSLAALFTAINSVLSGLAAWLGDNQWAASLIAFGAAVTGALGVILLFRAASFTATAALLAMRVLMQQTGASAIVAAGGFRGLIGTLFGVQGAANAAAGGIFTLRSAIRALLASTGIGLLITLGGSLLDGLIGQDSAAGGAALSLGEYDKAVRAAGQSTGDAAGSADDLANSLGGGGGPGGGGGVGGAAEDAAKKVRTLVDYVNDLNGVFRRSSDLRFGSTAALDEITLKWIELNEEAEKYQREIRSLTADRELQKYWLGIAELYDDQIRAGQLREGIAKIDDDLAKAQQGASRELQGNSRAAIENRKTMRDLLGSYEDYASALAAAGASQEEIQAVLASLNSDFTSQAQALGFAGGELVTYQARFNDLATIVNLMPRDITVGFNPDPALQAMNEFFAQQQEAAANAGAGAGQAYGGGFGNGLGGGIEGSIPTIDRGIGKATESVASNLRGFMDRTTEAWRLFFQSLGDGSWWNGVVASFNSTFTTFGTNFESFKQRFFAGWGSFWGSLADGSWFRGVIDSFTRSWNQMIYNLSQVKIAGFTPFSGLAPQRGRSGGGGFAGGGYTGPGHWLEPAGVVHKGEYVIPKRYVNQQTGLPDPSYVASLQKSKSAGPGYAMGGHVTGGGFPGYMELGPMTLHHLTQALQVRLDVDSRALASAGSRGDKQLAWTGSN